MSRPAPAAKSQAIQAAAVLLSVTLIVAILHLAEVVLVPVALAVLLTFILSPLVTRLDHLGFGRVPAVLVVVGTVGILLAALTWLVVSQLTSLANDLPNYRQNIREKVATLTQGTSGGVLDKVQSTLEDAAQQAEDSAQEAEDAADKADDAAEKADDAAEKADDAAAKADDAADQAQQSAQQAGVASRRAEDASPEQDPYRDDYAGSGDAAESDVPEQEPVLVRVVPEERSEKALTTIFSSLVALSPALGGLATAGLALVLVLFMLIDREDLRNRLVSFTAEGSLATTTKALDDAGQRISRYLIMQLIINGSYGVAVSLGLLLIGVPYALLWGLCAMVFRYIPYIGPWVAALMPLTVSLVTSPGWTQVLLVLGLFVVLELLSNNVMEPWLYGHGVGVSVVALLVSATFWTWTWGPIGLVLATPLTVCLVVIGKYVPALAFLDRLLGDRPALQPHAAYLQRLLARDTGEAAEIVQQYQAEHPPESVYDEVFLPALELVRQDRSRGTMEADEEAFVLLTTRSILATLAPAAPPADGKTAASSVTKQPDDVAGTARSAEASAAGDSQPSADPAAIAAGRNLQADDLQGDDRQGPPAAKTVAKVLGCPAHKEAEELTLHMLDQLIRPAGFPVEVLSTRNLPSDVVERVKRERPTVVVIAVLMPGGLVQARYLCKFLRKRCPKLAIVVGCWGYTGNLDWVIVKLRSAGADYITTSLLGAQQHVTSLAGTSTCSEQDAPQTESSDAVGV